MKKVQLQRLNKSNSDPIFGSLSCDGKLICLTLERPWLSNAPNISCIPEGEYKVVPHVSPRHGKCFHVESVPNRSNILFHAGNGMLDTQGCILTGFEVAPPTAIAQSRSALTTMLQKFTEPFMLVISDFKAEA